MNAFTFNTAPSILFGAGRAQSLHQMAGRLGERILIVTDPGLVRAGIVDPIVQGLRRNGLAVSVFDEVVADPPQALVLQATAAARAAGATGIVGSAAVLRWTSPSSLRCLRQAGSTLPRSTAST